MNLMLAKRILETAESMPFGFVKLRGHDVGLEADEMAKAGLLELSLADNSDPHVAIIKSITEAGGRLLGVLRETATARAVQRAFSYSPPLGLDLEIAIL